METKHLDIPVEICTYDELTPDERRLIDAAKTTTRHAYAPYSHFHVGAAILLADGNIITGTNQENAAYPSGICAERTAMFYANSRHPHTAPVMMAIAAHTDGDYTAAPTSPCGACRQVLIETETRYSRHIPLLLYSRHTILRLRSASDLLPLSFTATALNP